MLMTADPTDADAAFDIASRGRKHTDTRNTRLLYTDLGCNRWNAPPEHSRSKLFGSLDSNTSHILNSLTPCIPCASMVANRNNKMTTLVRSRAKNLNLDVCNCRNAIRLCFRSSLQKALVFEINLEVMFWLWNGEIQYLWCRHQSDHARIGKGGPSMHEDEFHVRVFQRHFCIRLEHNRQHWWQHAFRLQGKALSGCLDNWSPFHAHYTIVIKISFSLPTHRRHRTNCAVCCGVYISFV